VVSCLAPPWDDTTIRRNLPRGAPAMIDAAAVKARVDLLALLGADTRLRKVATTAGGEYAGACPFCGGRARLRVQPEPGRRAGRARARRGGVARLGRRLQPRRTVGARAALGPRRREGLAAARDRAAVVHGRPALAGEGAARGRRAEVRRGARRPSLPVRGAHP